MSVQPDGSFNVVCSGSVTPPPPPPPPVTGDAGSFAFAGATGTGATIGGDNGFPVTRSSGTTGVVSMNYTVAGAGCTNGVGTLTFQDGQTSANTFVWGQQAGSCTITLGNPNTNNTVATAPRLGNPSQMTVTIGNPNGGGSNPSPVAGCPAGPSDLASLQLGGVGNPLIAMAHSNQIVSFPLPAVTGAFSSGSIAFSESAGGAYTPQPVTLNISISKCPGVIDTDYSNRCNYVTTNGNYNSVTWMSQAYQAISNSTITNARGLCWAPSSEGQWYVNAKWSYSQCAFGAQVCGFAIQQNYGPY
jgi:hypothetical protein